VEVKWRAREDLTDTDIHNLFAHCGCVFKAEVDVVHKTATLYFTEKKAAQTAVSICRSNTYDVTTPHGLVRQKLISLQATQIGAEVFVGGLEPGVTEVKIKRGKTIVTWKLLLFKSDVRINLLRLAAVPLTIAFLPYGLIKAITILSEKRIAFVHYCKLSSARKAVQELNQVRINLITLS